MRDEEDTSKPTIKVEYVCLLTHAELLRRFLILSNCCIFQSLMLQISDSFIVSLCFSADALEKNQELEFERNKERFSFLKASFVMS